MKKLLQILFLFFISGFGQCFAQTNAYHLFPDSDAIWRGNYSCFSNNGGEGKIFGDSLAGDTVIGAYTYKKILRSGEDSYWPPLTKSYYTNKYIGSLRQDTAQRKVYFIGAGWPGDSLLYDFSLTIGDTIWSYNHIAGEGW